MKKRRAREGRDGRNRLVGDQEQKPEDQLEPEQEGKEGLEREERKITEKE